MVKSLRLKQAADILDCSERTVRRLIADGELEAFSLRKRSLRVTERSLNAYINRGIAGFNVDDFEA